jgi:hypothetical protein
MVMAVSPLDKLACAYRNGSDRMVIVRCIGSKAFFLERVVFPFELLSFECPRDAEVRIWTHGLGGPELLETIPVQELVVEPPTASLSAVESSEPEDLFESWVAAG